MSEVIWYYTDPYGTFWQYNAKVIGSGSEGADSYVQEQYNKVCGCALAVKRSFLLVSQAIVYNFDYDDFHRANAQQPKLGEDIMELIETVDEFSGCFSFQAIDFFDDAVVIFNANPSFDHSLIFP
ncbi:uncharacterized protein LOC141812717 [Curcuma longa]|uniref:uncharacterized protein LOC141812717 n=1 Tax=Curcuma longa TaxID=136217 RepID=UPI003D9E228E